MPKAKPTVEPGKTWDFTDPDNPQPFMWPQCADEKCKTPYIYRRFLSFTTGKFVWAWQRDCKHDKRKPQPGMIIMTKDGPVPATPEPEEETEP